MNDTYQNEWRFLNNFFTATRKQVTKNSLGSKFKRTFDHPETLYQRAQYRMQNPCEIKKSLDRKLKIFLQALNDQRIKTDEEKKEAA
jgi:hypothetical protein